LAFDPSGKYLVLGVVRWDVAVPIFHLVLQQRLKLLGPRFLMRVPYEAKLIEHFQALWSQGGWFPILQEFVLTALSAQDDIKI
jgi:hypothetical protein